MAQQQTQTPVNPAEAYERLFVPALPSPWAEDLLRRSAPRPGERLLDVACGTGIVARLATPRVGPTGAVVGVDPNPGMLAVARAVAATEGAAIDWREGRGEALPVEDAAFDLVCCQQGLQFFQDRAAGLREMRRTLVPGGRVAVSVGQGVERHPVHAALDEIVARHVGASAFAQTIFGLGAADELRALLARAGFRDVTVVPVSTTARFPDPAGFVRLQLLMAAAHMPALAGMDPAAREAAIAAIQADAEPVVRSFVEAGVLVITAHTHVAQGRA
ncbi:MAG: methyltransferase domain-containing protein [Thermomicrobiales bacterium]